MSAIPKTCSEFVEHPHIVKTTFTSGTTGETFERMAGCYSCQEASASEYQGTSQIAEALIKAGIQNVQVEQTGGFTMVVYVYNKDKTRALTVNSTGIYFEPDAVNGGEYEEITSPNFIPWEGEGCPPEICNQLTAQVVANLYRLTN
jgi:hypothetical protein